MCDLKNITLKIILHFCKIVLYSLLLFHIYTYVHYKLESVNYKIKISQLLKNVKRQCLFMLYHFQYFTRDLSICVSFNKLKISSVYHKSFALFLVLL